MNDKSNDNRYHIPRYQLYALVLFSACGLPFFGLACGKKKSSLARPLFYLCNPSPLPRPTPLPPPPLPSSHKPHQLDLDPPIPPAQSNNNHNNNAYGEGTSSSTSAWGATNGFETVNGSGGGGGGGPGVAGGPRGGSNGRGTAAGWSQRGGGGPAADGGGGGAWAGAGSMVSSGPGATILDEALAALFGGESVAGVKGRLNMEVGAFAAASFCCRRCCSFCFFSASFCLFVFVLPQVLLRFNSTTGDVFFR